MNISVTIDIYGGGPGSGCNGPNCGRPRKKNLSVALVKILQDEPRWHRQFTLRQKLGVGGVHQIVKRLGDRLEIERSGKDVRVTLKRIEPIYKSGDIESHLSTSPISLTSKLGGGINETYIVHFSNGGKAAFKVVDDADRELAAGRIAKLVGLQDLVPPSVPRTIAGKEGVLIAWVDGNMAKNVDRGQRYDGKTDLFRAAAFDFVIGNKDRHEGNWLINNGKLGLIDHGISLPQSPSAEFYKGFLEKASSWNGKPGNENDPAPSPKSLAAPYVENRDAINKVLLDLGIGEERRGEVQRKIDDLNSSATWNDLQMKLDDRKDVYRN